MARASTLEKTFFILVRLYEGLERRCDDLVKVSMSFVVDDSEDQR